MKKILTFSLIGVSSFIFAQIKQGEVIVNGENQIKQGEVTVQRNYEPDVTAVEKIKQTPKVEAPKSQKESISYNLVDIEAASDFQTSPISPEKLPINGNPLYNNYIKAGYGNNSTLKIDAFLNHNLDVDKSVGLNASYLGTKANLNDYNVFTNTNESKLNAEGFFNYNLQDALFTVKAGAGIHRLNLYGIPQSSGLTTNEVNDVTQRFTDVFVKANYDKFNGEFFKNANTKAYFFNNNFGSNELGFNANTKLNTGDLYEADFFGGLILGGKTGVNLHYSNTNFDDKIIPSSKFSFFNVGATPQLEIKNDVFNLSAGVNLQYVNNSNKGENKFHLFPNAQIKIITVPEFVIYGGITGGVNMNTYQSFAKENPYIQPNQDLRPTVNQFEFFGGIAGDIGSNFKYNAKAGFQSLKDEFFFIKNDYSKTLQDSKPFTFANSFITKYDDAKRTYINGVINYVGVEKLELGASVNLQAYVLDNLKNAYEKPALSGEVTARYSMFGERLVLGGDLLLKGSRKGLTYVGEWQNAQQETIDLNSYMDLNFNAHFLLNNQWTIFAEANNILNNNYERFADYRVQGLNVLGGVQYKF